MQYILGALVIVAWFTISVASIVILDNFIDGPTCPWWYRYVCFLLPSMVWIVGNISVILWLSDAPS